MKNELQKIKETAETNGLSTRRIQALLMDTVKKAGLVTEDGLPTLEARNLVRKTLGQKELSGVVGLSGCVER